MTTYKRKISFHRWTGLILILCMGLYGGGLSLAQDRSGHVLNFTDADIRTVIGAVSEMTGKTMVIDPQVAGRVSVISTDPLDDQALYEVFLSILSVHGFAAVSDDRVVRILPDAKAWRDGRTPVEDMRANGDEPITRILSLEHVEARELVELLRTLVPQSAYLAHHERSNVLIVSDRASSIRRIEAIVRRLDAQSHTELEAIVLSHADAGEVVELIGRLYPNAAQDQAVADERTNTVVLSGDPARRLRLKTLITHLDTPLSNDGRTQVVYLRYATAKDLVEVLQSMVPDGESTGAATTRIQAHEPTNSLVITATPSMFKTIESVVKQLDIRRAQVQVEAIIAEVAVDTSQELGIQWQAFSSGDSGLFGGTNFQTGGNNILTLSGATGQAGEAAQLVLPGQGLNVGYVRGRSSLLGVEILEIGALARALSQDANTNVLSTPSVVTMDNHPANINVGQEVPFVSGSFSAQGVASSDGQINPFQTIERKEIGIKLNVTPHINEGDEVMLAIEQEVSTLAPSAGAVDLITNKRTISTRVMVPDGAILVLGGLTTEDVQERLEAVPGLGQVPLLGELFKYRRNTNVKRNLMVFIRPTILHDDEIMDEVTGRKYSSIREAQLKSIERAQPLSPAKDAPLLPELEDFLQQPPPNEQ
jgi:general secretion pathway protein D